MRKVLRNQFCDSASDVLPMDLPLIAKPCVMQLTVKVRSTSNSKKFTKADLNQAES